jgi:CRISPR/Cas system CSM-associated protein Csm3 (group 7 of RAMP superfamily)
MNEEKHQYYRGVPLVRKLTTEVESERGHQIYSDDMFTGRLRGSLHTLAPLHVGTGLVVPPADVGLESDIPLLKSFHAAGGRLTIPGSSLKGAVRSLVEMLTYACVNKTKTRWRSKRQREEYQECRYNSKRREGELCTACKMFGAMGYEGQIYFHDAPQV